MQTCLQVTPSRSDRLGKQSTALSKKQVVEATRIVDQPCPIAG